jgi:WD40 repeat protein
MDGGPSVGDPLTGHDGDIYALAVGSLPDGRPVIVSGGNDGTIRTWELNEGTVVEHSIIPAWGYALAVGTLSERRPVIVGGDGSGYEGTIRIWELDGGAPVGDPLTGHDGGVTAVTVGFLPDGRPVIVSGSRYDETIRIWDLPSQQPLAPPLQLGSVQVVRLSCRGWIAGTVSITSGGWESTDARFS